METASGKYYHNNRRNLQKDNPSNPKKDNLLVSSNGCNGLKLTFPDGKCDSLALQQRASNKEISNIDEMDLLEPSFSVNPDTNRENILSQSSEFEDSIEYDFLNETYSIHYSESKLKNEDHLHSELHTEVQNREEAFDTLEHQGNKTIGFGRTHKVSDTSYEETAEDAAEINVDEDSQLEYHSAEQEYINNHLSFDQAKTLSVSNLHCVELSNSGYEDKWVSGLEDDHVQLGSGSVISLDSLNEFTFAQEYLPPVSKSQNSAMLKEFHEPKHDKCKEKETGLMYHIEFDDTIQRSSSLLDPQKPLKAKTCTEKKKSQTISNKDFCGTGIVEDEILQHLDHSSISPQEKASETLPQVRNDGQTSMTFTFDDSLNSACGHSQYKSLQSTPNSRISAIQSQAVTEDSCLQVVNSTTNKTCPQPVTDAASCTITVSQTLDVGTDFKACFTTSRTTNEKSPVVSTSSNTEITMMDRKCLDEWPRERQRSVACNTDWAHLQDCVDTLMAVPVAPGRLLSVDSVKPSGYSLDKDSLEVRKMFDTDLKKHPERELQFSEAMEKNLASECCQRTMHRAIKAETHLLNVYYQTCRRHCYHIYKLVMQNRTALNRNLPNNFAKKELGSALLSVLEDLKVRYMDLKERIHKGIPLEELPPLSIESKILSVFSAFASRLMKEDILIGHPKQDKSPKEDGFKNYDTNVNFSQLKLNDEEFRNRCEVSEDWCDAAENLMGSDISGAKEDQIEPDAWNLNCLLEKKHVELFQGDKGFLLHVGDLCSSVSEADLRYHFQKYQVSEISIYNSSTDYRYASLAFTKNSDAKRAAKEMNGTEINGKSVNVRLVKNPAEHTQDRVHLEKSSKEVSPASAVSRLPQTRPRWLESEQDSESSCMDHKGIKKNCKQVQSHLLPKTSAQLIPPDTLNLRSFTKIMKRLTELHPEVNRDQIIDALQEVRTNHKGFLNGLSIGTIVEMTSSFLKNGASH
uniref:RNA-binding protein 44 n=1 Tax=Jaculus jaculus TaxID=51337 RepID=UPI001E1B0FE5|nr:RNA-binding protein 44 [Jaculus jaculus]